MAVPNIFGSATSAIPLSQLDQNFATAITLGNTAVYLGNTTTSLGNVTLTNVTISSGNVTLTGANVSGTANVSTLIVTGNQTSLGNVAITGNISANIATFGAGSNTAPSITTTGDTNTGIFFPAADTIAFSEGGAESMRINSSGNVGIGTISPTARLSVSGTTPQLTNGIGQLSVFSTDAIGADKGGKISLGGVSGEGGSFDPYGFCAIAGLKDNATASNFAGYLTFSTSTSGGTVTERMRITSGGDLLVGATSGSPDSFGEKLFVSQSGANSAFVGSNTNASCTSAAIIGVTADRNTTNNSFYAISYYNRGAAAYKFRVADSGNVTNTNNSYGNISDVKLKENIVDATPKLEKLLQVRIVNYNLKADLGYESHKQIGVIAQELEQVFPSLVDESVDRDKEGNDLGTTTKSVKMSVFVPMLIKAIQEQQAIITQLQADVAALKGTA